MPDEKPYYTTGCRFCGFRLSHAAFEVIDLAALDGKPPKRLEEFTGKLAAHLQRCADDEEAQIEAVMRKLKKRGAGTSPPDLSAAKHRQAWGECRDRAILAHSTGILAAFSTTDPALNAMLDVGRWMLHQATRKFYFTDALLLDRVQALALSPKAQAAVLALVSEIRDVLAEHGNYMPGKEGAAIAEGAAAAGAAVADGRPAG